MASFLSFVDLTSQNSADISELNHLIIWHSSGGNQFLKKLATAMDSAISSKKIKNLGGCRPGGGFSGMKKARSR